MIFNFTDDHQLATRLYMEDVLLETITRTKLLCMIVQSDLKWSENTNMIVKKVYQRMLILQKLNIADEDTSHKLKMLQKTCCFKFYYFGVRFLKENDRYLFVLKILKS